MTCKSGAPSGPNAGRRCHRLALLLGVVHHLHLIGLYDWETPVKVRFCRDHCTGDGLCALIAPELFALNGDGRAVLVGGKPVDAPQIGGDVYETAVSAHCIYAVLEVAQECPECVTIAPADTEGGD